MTIAHISDLHFGRLAGGGIVEALVHEVNRDAIDRVVISGDLTQRARHREFGAAQEFLSDIEAPTLVVPGNHDVYPWWRPVRRLWTPLRRYKEYITDDLAPSFEADGVAAFGLTSPYGASIKGGRVTVDDRAAMQSYFADVDPAAFKVLVLHHHLTRIPSLRPHDVVGQAQRTLDAAAEAGVDLILCGHLHVSHIEPIQIIPGTPRVVVASAGTATSNRWRAPQYATNFYNVITVGADAFQIEERRYVRADDHFVADGTTHFDRTPVAPSADDDFQV